MQQGTPELTLLPQAGHNHPVITVTLNPVVDMTYHIPHFLAGKTFLADKSNAYAGGKGVNASRALLHLNIASTATGIIGQKGKGTYLDILDNEGIRHVFMQTQGTVRTNATVITPGRQETHIRDRGPRLNTETFQKFRTHFKSLVSETTGGASQSDNNLHDFKPIVILSGSIPEGLPAESYGMLLHDAHEMGALTVLDASGEAMRIGLVEKPHFIKPNRHETEEALGFLPQSEADYRKAIGLFHTKGTVLVMISRGREGLYLSNGHTTVSASVRVEEAINTVGSGDAAVAGGVYSIIHELGIEETARLSCALGAANTITAGACIFETDHVKKLYQNVVVKRL